ncbi:MAG: hypothetical protein U0Q12_22865 [Vicinamibacterales bacterium]
MSVRYALGVAAAAACLTPAFAAGPAGQAKPSPDKRAIERDAQERAKVVPVVRVVDAMMAGEVETPDDGRASVTWTGHDGQTSRMDLASPVDLSWRNHFLKADKKRTYVPFSVTVDAKKLPSTSVAAYLRVVPRGDRPDVPRASGNASFAFEDYYVTELRSVVTAPPPPIGAAAPPPPVVATPVVKTGPQEVRLTRAFAVPAGDYDVYVGFYPRMSMLGAIADTPEKGGVAATGAQPPKTPPVKDDKNGPTGTLTAYVLHQVLSVPDFWTDELTTSSIVVADRLDALAVPPPVDAQRERPYIVGAAELVPAADNQLKKTEQLTVFFQIYNPVLDDNRKPDVSVDYVFERNEAGEEKTFNRIPAQSFNARTLPLNFDISAGHQLSAGWSVPLSSFPVGDYRLAITVTDKKSGRQISRDVQFTVVGT